MKFLIIQFPGSNCDHDCLHALQAIDGAEPQLVWHRDVDFSQADAVVLPGGFSYGDYLRAGAIAGISPAIQGLKKFAEAGGLVLGICNGFQILCEAGLLPGALALNESQKFICRFAQVRIETTDSPFTFQQHTGRVLRLPVAHGEGRYVADSSTLSQLRRENRILFRYDRGETSSSNPNGSVDNIAGILNSERNVLGMMPHPERACSALLGSEDGLAIFQAMVQYWSTVQQRHSAAA
ncbi:MAG: phosphoribosylformylglycinamidine synthase subunit PurQ [Verrucomicrobiales bacterium]